MMVVSNDWGRLLPPGQDGFLTPDEWEEIGQSLATRILRRTRSGVDAAGTTFHAYSAGYARRKAREVGAGPVNLTLSGQMLNDLRVMATSTHGCELGFSTFGAGARRGTLIQRSRSTGANEKAFYATEGSHGVVRNFFDLSDDDEIFVADAVGQVIDDHLGTEGAA